MRSSIHGTFATLLLLIPVGAIPALAIFGIPQFAPVVASPLHEGHERDREHRVGESARAPADDLFHDDTDFPARGDDASSAPGRVGDSVAVPQRDGQRGSWNDHESDNSAAEVSGRLPDWSRDSAVDDRRPANPLRDSLRFDRRASGNGAATRNDSEPDRFASRAPEGNKEPAPQYEPGGSGIRRVENETNDPRAPKGYQRQRAETVERTVPAPRDDTARDALTWQGALRRLNELEIRNFRLEPSRQANQFVFICSYTPSDSPRVSYRFEAESEEPLKAVEKVLAQIDEWQQRR